MQKFKESVYKTKIETEGENLYYYQRSNDTTLGSACGATILHNCRIDVFGNASVSTPETGNKVYNGLSGTTLFNGLNLRYVFVIGIAPDLVDVFLCQVNTLGVITEVTPVTCPSEP